MIYKWGKYHHKHLKQFKIISFWEQKLEYELEL